MADQQGSIFSAKAAERLRSPDDLDKYVQVTNPSVWMVLAACIVLLAGLLAWGIFGTVQTDVSGTGTLVAGTVVCPLDAEHAAQVSVGDHAVVNGIPMQVSAVGSVPLSRDELGSLLPNDYLASTLAAGDWSYIVELSVPDTADGVAEGVPLPVSITVESVAPLSLVFGA